MQLTCWGDEVLWCIRPDWRWIQLTDLGWKWIQGNSTDYGAALRPDSPTFYPELTDASIQLLAVSVKSISFWVLWPGQNWQQGNLIAKRFTADHQMCVFQPEQSLPPGMWEEIP